MLTGAIGLTISLFFECLLQALYTNSSNTSGQQAAIFFIFLFIVFWSSCFDATQYLYMAEIWPTAIRGQGTAVGHVQSVRRAGGDWGRRADCAGGDWVEVFSRWVYSLLLSWVWRVGLGW